MEKITNQPITIRGKAYPNHAAAALVLGVKEATITSSHRHGTLDTVGMKGRTQRVIAKNYDGTADAEHILKNIMHRRHGSANTRDALKLQLETIVAKYSTK